jgi:SAM-dependent methyltransferase
MSARPQPDAAQRDYLSAYLEQAPASLALLRAVECRELQELAFEPPVLDLGCGDGLFAQMFFQRPPDVGLDFSRRELRTAQSRGVYQHLLRADIAALPFADGSFATVFANGVLEHVGGLRAGLSEVARVLHPGGALIMTVPTMRDELELSGAALLRGLGARRAAQRYADTYNQVFKQINILDGEQWEQLLADCGLRLVTRREYAAPAVLRLHDATMPLSLPHFAIKALTGRWVLWPGWRRGTIAPLWARLLRRIYRDDLSAGCSLLLVAQPIDSASGRSA